MISIVPLSNDASHVVAVRLPRSSARFRALYDVCHSSMRCVGYTIDWWKEGGGRSISENLPRNGRWPEC